MRRKLAGILTLATALAACGNVRRAAIEAEMSGDAAHGTATMTCRASTSGTCHALFLTGEATKTGEAPVGASATVTGLAPATRFCVGASEPDPPRCHPMDLTDVRQTVRHERRETD
jgi:hypothetical protein